MNIFKKLLDKKDEVVEDEVVEKDIESKISKTKGLALSLLLTLFLSWVVSWLTDINPFLIFVIVQVIAFTQSAIAGWLGKFLE